MTKAWDDYKEVIIVEYKEHNKPLHEVQRIMEERHRFKASSRLDKWGVYKYSCRKRNGSSGANDDGSPDDDTPVLSPPTTPRQQHTSPQSDPDCPGTPGPMSPITPISHHYFGGPLCGTTPPSELGSPASANTKYESQQSHYPPHNQFGLHPPRHSVSLPISGYMSPPLSYYGQHQHHHHHQYSPHVDYYRTQPQSNDYHQHHQHSLQGQVSMNAAVSTSVPSSPNHGRFAQFNHSWMSPDQTKTPPE
ncbi:hypothetical protein B0T14DRAFT_498265 [Immersiella caudata]|uniref:Clr5 domain-containing protein n=1 Tax=Immersiella caudata TaxID=314043 RepID=A0AA39WKT7_9PEZI|nr:hypothetical protein B0T14DRAFT_498265 [Immersiella caudata]